MKAARAPLAILLLLGILLAAGGTAYLAYFATPDITDPPSSAPTRTTPARRALLFIIDGFAAVPPVESTVMPTFARLASEGAHGVAHTSSMSLTAPCVYSLGTGRPGTLTLGVLDFHAPPVHLESLPSLATATGRRVSFSGDPSWSRQFGWLALPEDLHAHPEPGITLDPRVRRDDRVSVEFLFSKLRDPRYALVVVHVSSADAAGHLVTPFAPEYRDALTFLDGLLGETLATVDNETIVLVTGDHGMGPRGTHGGRDDDATLTPYVLWGPGVRAGASSNLAQTALPPTIAALIGLPMPAASENPPATDLMALDTNASQTLLDEFIGRKLAAARSLVPALALPPRGDLATVNAHLNEILFASTDPRIAARIATFALFTLAAAVALLFARAEMPARQTRDTPIGLLLSAFAVPLAFVAAATTLIAWRSALPFQPEVLAVIAATLLGVGCIVVAITLYHSATARERFERAELAVYFWASVLLATPLLTSGWFSNRHFFQLLAVALVGVGFIASRRMVTNPPSAALGWCALTLLAVGFATTRQMNALASEWPFVLPGTIAVLVLAIASLRDTPRSSAIVGAGVLVAGAVSALVWRAVGGTMPALAMLAVFATGIAWATVIRRTPFGAAAIVVGVSTFLGLTMASDTQEAIMFLVAGLVTLCLTQLALPLGRPRAIYFAALAALALRLALYISLGDSYSLNSIRTAPGFRLAEAGLSLPLVITTLLLKYALPWLMILAIALPALKDDDTRLGRRFVQLLALGYVARFFALAAVADPFRVLPHG
ncbi:MAG: alkaline phosphatase, partial [Candidatus Binatia bacterium]